MATATTWLTSVKRHSLPSSSGGLVTQSSSKIYWLSRISALKNVSVKLQQGKQLKSPKRPSTQPTRLWRASLPTRRSRRGSRYPQTARSTVVMKGIQTETPAQPRTQSARVAKLAITGTSASAEERNLKLSNQRKQRRRLRPQLKLVTSCQHPASISRLRALHLHLGRTLSR